MVTANILGDRITQFFSAPVSVWWDWRRKRFWVIVLVALYTLAGFFLAPWIARREVVDGLQSYLDLPVQLEELRINPWSMTVEASGFSIDEPDGTTIIGFDRLFVNFQASSLFRWALTFREITLDHPYGGITRDQNGALNADRIIEAGNGESEEPASDDVSAPLRLLIQNFTINDGLIEARDESHATPFAASIGPINIAVQDLTTLPDRSGQHHVAVSTARGTRLEWSGSFELDPVVSSGRVTGSGPYVPLLYQYFQDQLNFELTEGHVDLQFDYEIAVDPDTGLEAKLMNANTVLRDAALTIEEDGAGKTRFANLPEIRLEDGDMSWPEQTMTIGAVIIADPELKLWLDEEGVLNLERLLAAPSQQPPPQDADQGAEAETPQWDIALGEFRIENLTAEFTDRGLEKDGTLVIGDLDFSLRDITNRPGDAFPLEATLTVEGGGEVNVNGKIQALPETNVDADITVTGLSLAIVQPWVADVARVEIDAGTLDVVARLNVTGDEALGVTGSVKILGLDISDATLDERLVGWSGLDIDRMELSLAENRLEISQLTIDEPYSRLRIAADQTTNYQDLAITDDAAAPEVSTDAGTESSPGAMALTVGRIIVNDGSADFSDLSLPLPFAARISELSGRIDTLATVGEEPAKIDLAGQVDEYGLVEISGQIKPLDPTGLTDISVLFRNVGMPGLSPYTIKFAGREIAEGRMSLDLRYAIDNGQLQGTNGIVIDKLQLGEKVDHPDATNLPLGLAVALLKGPDGSIHIDMPVSGNVDDPEFSVGGVVFKAFVNLITKIAASPFNLLGRLVGIESEDFDRIEFRPGLAELAPPEQEKLIKLAEAMTLRPNLDLQLSGVADSSADAEALRVARVTAKIEARLTEPNDENGDAAMLTERRRKVVEALARETLTTVDFNALEAENQRPKDPDNATGRQVLDKPAYTAALEGLLIESENISEENLDQLAMARAMAVRDAVIAGGQVDATRIPVGEVAVAELNDDGWVPMQLELSTGKNDDQVSELAVSN